MLNSSVGQPRSLGASSLCPRCRCDCRGLAVRRGRVMSGDAAHLAGAGDPRQWFAAAIQPRFCWRRQSPARPRSAGDARAQICCVQPCSAITLPMLALLQGLVPVFLALWCLGFPEETSAIPIFLTEQLMEMFASLLKCFSLPLHVVAEGAAPCRRGSLLVPAWTVQPLLGWWLDFTKLSLQNSIAYSPGLELSKQLVLSWGVLSFVCCLMTFQLSDLCSAASDSAMCSWVTESSVPVALWHLALLYPEPARAWGIW